MDLRVRAFSPQAFEASLSHLQSVFPRRWRHDAIHAQVLDKLAVVVGDVPDGND